MEPNTTLPKEPKIRVYSAMLSQAGTAAPTAYKLQNTLGTVTLHRTGAGVYELRCGTTGLFSAFHASVIIGPPSLVDTIFYVVMVDENTIEIRTEQSGSAADDILQFSLIKVEYYSEPIDLP